ncbi:hypothetical protein HPB50_003911 [Hyalomma asiaticum]|uniref:Uncharacterized protein n=1 Tax=Hyalomma asiaticum TaxID=266040 RepID=A0ACB7T5X4_HYAAI|nr:hypothetical protein HPB50_003911 [Hyalomma asiaticum]
MPAWSTFVALLFNAQLVLSRQLTPQFDPEGFGEIPWADFLRALETPEFCQAVGPAKREILTAKAHRSRTSAITFDDFVAVVSPDILVFFLFVFQPRFRTPGSGTAVSGFRGAWNLTSGRVPPSGPKVRKVGRDFFMKKGRPPATTPFGRFHGVLGELRVPLPP